MSFGIWELVIILAIVALLFGTKKLKTMGADLGGALKGFRNAIKEEDTDNAPRQTDPGADPGADQGSEPVIEGEVDKGDTPQKVDR